MDSDWHLKRVDTALEAHTVDKAVSPILKEALGGTMRQHSLSSGDLSKLAELLLEAELGAEDAEASE